MANEYANVGDLMDRLSIDEDDAREGQLHNILETASRWVDQQTGHRFYSATQTRYFNPIWHYPHNAYGFASGGYPWGNPERPSGGGYADSRVWIDDCTAATVVATDEDGDGVYERTWTVATDYWLGPRNATVNGQPFRYLNRNMATGRFIFPPWEESIAVTGSFGWCTLANRPADIRELTLMVAEWMAVTLTDLSQPGVQSYDITDQLKVAMAPDVLPVAGQDIINYYKGVNLL